MSSNEMVAHYTESSESTRLTGTFGRLEYERTLATLKSVLPPPPATILDVGGAAGIYAFSLAKQGYKVRLLDIVPKHVEQAREASQKAAHPLLSVDLGDARALAIDDQSVDAVLLLGPLYHLTERADRVQALSEAYRVLRADGVVVAAAISRFASSLDGLAREVLTDPVFVPIVDRDLQDGQHRNPTNHPEYFTEGFFHLPAELSGELEEVGFSLESVRAVEGPAWLLPSLSNWMDGGKRETQLLDLLERFASHENVIGTSAHFLGIGRKPSNDVNVILNLKSCQIRTWSINDVDSLAEHANDPDIARYLRDRFPHPYTKENARQWIAFCRNTKPSTNFAISVDGVAVGSIGVMLQTDVSRRGAEVGYWLGKKYWGRGIVSEALKEFSDWCFRNFDLVRLYANAFEGNAGSTRVLEKAGFTFEAVLRKAAFKNGKVLDEMLYARVLETE